MKTKNTRLPQNEMVNATNLLSALEYSKCIDVSYKIQFTKFRAVFDM